MSDTLTEGTAICPICGHEAPRREMHPQPYMGGEFWTCRDRQECQARAQALAEAAEARTPELASMSEPLSLLAPFYGAPDVPAALMEVFATLLGKRVQLIVQYAVVAGPQGVNILKLGPTGTVKGVLLDAVILAELGQDRVVPYEGIREVELLR